MEMIMAENVKSQQPEAPTKPSPNQKLPAGFKNPPVGVAGHYCVDRNGAYQPLWYQLYLRRPEGQEVSFEYFSLNDKQWYVPYNRWVDVPPEIVKILEDAVSDVIKTNVDEATGKFTGDLTQPGTVAEVVDTVPAFSYTLLQSA